MSRNERRKWHFSFYSNIENPWSPSRGLPLKIRSGAPAYLLWLTNLWGLPNDLQSILLSSFKWWGLPKNLLMGGYLWGLPLKIRSSAPAYLLWLTNLWGLPNDLQSILLSSFKWWGLPKNLLMGGYLWGLPLKIRSGAPAYLLWQTNLWGLPNDLQSLLISSFKWWGLPKNLQIRGYLWGLPLKIRSGTPGWVLGSRYDKRLHLAISLRLCIRPVYVYVIQSALCTT